MKYWVTFVSEGRAGHTIVAAIVGVHPNARISEEEKYISRWYRGDIKVESIIPHLIQTGYGRMRLRIAPWPGLLKYYDPLLVIGDKVGWDAVNLVKNGKAPEDIITKFSEAIDLPVKVVHVSRNPYQNIANWYHSKKYKRLWGGDSDERMRMAVKRYARFYDTAEKVMKNQDVFHLRHEELILNPSDTIIALMNFVELPQHKDHRRMCKRYLYKEIPTRPTSWNDKWNKEIKDRIIDRFPSLDYYKKKK